MIEEFLELEGEDIDLKQLSRSFPSGPVRVERPEPAANSQGRYFLIVENETARKDEDVLAEGTKALAQMVAIVLQGGSRLRPPKVRGIAKKTADGSLITQLSVSFKVEARTSVTVNVRLIGPNGEIVKEEGPTEDQVTYELARNSEPLRRALLIYGSLEHNWINLYKVLDAMRDGNGGLTGLQAKNFVAAHEIEDFTATANSPIAIGLEARHGWDKGVPRPRMTFNEAEEMFRRLFEGWIAELKRSLGP